MSRIGWRDRQNISILVELTVCQKNVANALNLIEINGDYIEKLDGQGRARREAARHRKSECKINLGPR